MFIHLYVFLRSDNTYYLSMVRVNLGAQADRCLILLWLWMHYHKINIGTVLRGYNIIPKYKIDVLPSETVRYLHWNILEMGGYIQKILWKGGSLSLEVAETSQCTCWKYSITGLPPSHGMDGVELKIQTRNPWHRKHYLNHKKSLTMFEPLGQNFIFEFSHYYRIKGVSCEHKFSREE